MKITPQDIIDKEFGVKFLGFDKVEVDAFLEEVAENFFRLNEENIRLNEKILALRKEMESGGRITPLGQMELPAELDNFLEELKQDITAISAELVSLKQDRPAFVSLEKSFKEAVASLQKAAPIAPSQGQAELPVDLKHTLEEFKKGFGALKAELAALKQEVGSLQQIRKEIKGELQELLTSHFNDLAAKLSKTAPPAVPEQAKSEAAAEVKKKQPAAAIIKEEPADSRLPDFEEQDESRDNDDLEFLSEDDLLDVDKLRGIFQSVLDDSISDAPNSRDGDDNSSGDLLFLEDDFLEDEHEPEVTFTLEESKTEKKTKSKRT